MAPCPKLKLAYAVGSLRLLKIKKPPQAVLRLRGRLNVWCAVDCAEGGLGAMLTPVSISAFPVRGYSIAEDVVGVNTFMQSPLVVAGRPLNAWECYNYKSLAAVAHTPEWDGTPVAGKRG